MFQEADLLSILVGYAKKINSPYVDIVSFLDYLGKAARIYSKDNPAWKKWQQERTIKFWSEISTLAEGGKCELLTDSENGRIYVSCYYPEMLSEIYKLSDENADMPFPNEESIRITLPETQVKNVNVEYDLHSILASNKNAETPILKINFPEGFGSALVLPSMIPRQLTEIAIIKVRNYLRRYGNREYIFHKLTSTLQGKESYLKDQLDQIIIRPIDLYRAIEESRELTSAFWSHFCSLVKNDIKKKKEYLLVDIATFQAINIIEVINGHFRSLALKKRDLEIAFKALEGCLAKPPYLYTMDQIIKFTGASGAPLLGQYTAEQLETWLRKQTTESSGDELPVLLIIKNTKGGSHWFIFKDKILLLCSRLLTDARILIKNKISKHWSRLIFNYESEAAMENNEDFEKALLKIAEKHCPDLMLLLEDPKLSAVYFEMDAKENGIPPSARIFNKGKLLPYSYLFNVRRKDLMVDAKLVLPFWYSMPLLSSIVGFFKKLLKRKPKKTLQQEDPDKDQDILEEKDHAAAIKDAAEDLELDLVPPGYTLDLYLKTLEDRWSRLIDKVARENLINDVQYLVKDSLRRTMKINKQFKPTREALNQIADNLVVRNQALSSLSSRNSLIFYMELYMIKLLVNIK